MVNYIVILTLHFLYEVNESISMNEKDHELLDNWFVLKDYSEATQYNYRLGLKQYCKLTGKTLSELLYEADYEEDNIKRLNERKITTYLVKFKKTLKQENKAPQTIKVYVSGVKSFYKYNNIQIPDINVKVGELSLEKNEAPLLTREEIQKMVEVAPLRDKAIIYLMALTGMSQREARTLKINQFLKVASQSINKKIETIDDLFSYEKELQNEILTLHLTREKVKYRHFTFIPPEVTHNIILYLKDRLYGENEKLRITNYDSTLFVTNSGKELTKQGVAANFRRIGSKVGFAREKGAYSPWRSHSLRKYFISTIINNIGDHTLADFLAGHKIDNIKRTYWKADPEKIKERYMRVFEYLSIDEVKVKSIETEGYLDLKNQMDVIMKVLEENDLQAEVQKRRKRT